MTSDETYELAANAVRRKQFKKAINYFKKILKKEPDYINARKGLRAVQVTEAEESKVPVGLKAPHLALKTKFLVMKKKYDDAIIACEEILCIDPSHVPTLQTLLRCAEEMEYTNTVMFTHESLSELSPGDAGIVIAAADFLSDLNTSEGYEKANKLMDALAALDPDDTDLTTEQSRIAAKKSITTIESAQTTTDVLANKDEAAKLETQTQDIRTDKDLEDAIARALDRDKKEPNNPRHKESIAKLFARQEELHKAAEYYEMAVELDQNNQNAHASLSDIKMRILEKQISKMLKRKAKMSKDVEKKEQSQRIKKAKKKLLDLRYKECKRRLEINPNDLKARYDLGNLYFSLKKFDQAITQFQKSVQDANLSFKSGELLGHCFKEKKIFDLAINEFENASKKPGVKISEKLSVMSEIGDCYYLTKKLPEALDIFKKILEKDYGFKDISKRVEQLQEEIDSQ
jgi:tetratricopeptide (TPR) repeat protein